MLHEIVTGIGTLVSGIGAIGGLFLKYSESKDKTFTEILKNSAPQISSVKLPETRAKNTPEMIVGVSNEKFDDEALLRMLAIYIAKGE